MDLKWREVLAALCGANKFVTLEELTKLSDQEEPAVMAALNFLHAQGWVECGADGSQWACTPQTRVVLESMEHITMRAL